VKIENKELEIVVRALINYAGTLERKKDPMDKVKADINQLMQETNREAAVKSSIGPKIGKVEL
jgi:hypothetical protein